MRENEKKNGSLFDKPPKIILKDFEDFLMKCCLWGLYPTKTIQITKINKNGKLLQGQKGKKSTNEEQKSTKIRRL